MPPAPLVLMFTNSVGADATPIAFSDATMRSSRGWSTVRKILVDDHGQEFYEVQSHVVLTGHITE